MQDGPELQHYENIEQVPIADENRQCTDICCTVTGILFTVTLLVIAIVGNNSDNFLKTNFPADTAGRLCGIDVKAYPYVYFVEPPSIAKRVCVSECPSPSDKKLKCTPTDEIGCRFSNVTGFKVENYENEAVVTRNGMFCYPKDEKVKNELLQKSNLLHRAIFMNSLEAVQICMLAAFGLSIVYMLLVQFIPRAMNVIAVVLGIVVMIAVLVCMALYDTLYVKSKWGMFIIFLIFVLITIFTVLRNRQNFQIHGIFLDEATKMLCDNIHTFAYIVLFLVFSMAFTFMLIFEFQAFWTSGEPTFEPDTSLFYEIKTMGPVLLTALWLLQAIWGFSFLKEAFNFCVSGTAVQWYYNKEDQCCSPFSILWTKHFGSVIGGSFMTGFFTLGDYFFDFIKPDDEDALLDQDSCYSYYTSCFNCAFRPCLSVFELVRSDAMAFVYLTGNPYCNSARYCEYLCENSLVMEYSQSTSRAYRICAHFLIAGIVAIIGLYIKGSISLIVVMVIVALSLFISTFFISLHADAAEAIEIILLEEEEFGKRQKEKDRTFNRNGPEGFGVSKREGLSNELREYINKRKLEKDQAREDKDREDKLNDDQYREEKQKEQESNMRRNQ